jgi:glutamate synthase (NADPH/NADH) small chain
MHQAPIDPDRSESVFEDKKPALTDAQALAEANRCLYCYDAPCIKACPTSIDIPEFIRKISTSNVRGAAKTIFSANILGQSCARVCPVEVLCVGACVYNDKGEAPIQIGKLQRYATDAAVASNERFFEAGAPTGKSVGLVGGGPASLACAHELRRFGHKTVVYEKRPVLGGLNTTGIAPYKLRADASVKEVDSVLGIGGIDVRTGVESGRDLGFAELEKQHDAVFFGVGLGPDSRLDIPGAELGGVGGAVDFIERMKLGKVDLSKVEHGVVIGGGNTAIDVVRELVGLGVEKVTMIYRGTEEQMSAYEHEWEGAKIEGAVAEWRALPVAYEGGIAVERVRLVRMDADKKPIAGTEYTIAADVVLVATGQSKLGQLLAEMNGIVLEMGRVVTDEEGATGRKGWYAGGDAKNGGKEVVNAVAEGRDAARAIHRFLMGGAA